MTQIGIRIKELRLALGLTQEELGDRCDLTKGYISQLENDLTSPSIDTLKSILDALGTSLYEFFKEEPEPQLVFTEQDYFHKNSEGYTVNWLVPNSQKNEMEPILMHLEPGCRSDDDMPHEGEEFGFVLRGSIKLHHGSRVLRLKKGDSFYFVSDKKHFIECVSKDGADVIWISSPPNF